MVPLGRRRFTPSLISFIATIERAVDVEHGSVALVHVLRSEAEHVIVEPVRAHGFMPVAGDLVDAAAAVGSAGPVDQWRRC